MEGVKKVKIIKSGKKRVKAKPLGYGVKRNKIKYKERLLASNLF